jgi:ankyrin repeat protein
MNGILEAAGAGDVSEVERLVRQDPGLLDVRDARGMTPLMCASQKGHMGVVLSLLDKGAAIHAQSPGGWTALLLACSFVGHPPLVRLLVERGADPATCRDRGSTALMFASLNGHLEVVRVLLGLPSAKATINHRNSHGCTALWLACRIGREGMVRLLLEGGADHTIADNNGNTPMAPPRRESLTP